MNVVEIDNKTIRYASRWDELTRCELLEISRLLLQNLSPAEFKLRLIYKILGLQGRILIYNRKFYVIKWPYRWLRTGFLINYGIKKGHIKRLSRQNAYFLSETLNWMFSIKEKEEKTTYRLSNTLSRNLLPTLKAGPFNKTLYGPGDYLKDTTAIEFAKAQVRYEGYVNAGEEQHLNGMVAALYRPGKKGKRLPYSDELTEKSAASIKGLPLKVRYAVFLFFQGCVENLKKDYPLCFHGQPAGDEGEGYGWAGVFRALTEGKIADIDRVMELPIHTVMMDLNEKIKASRKLEEKLRKYEPHK